MNSRVVRFLSLVMFFSGALWGSSFEDFKAALEAEVARQCPGGGVDVRHLKGPYFGGGKSMTQTFAQDGKRAKQYPVYVVAGDEVGALRGLRNYFLNNSGEPYPTLNQPGWRSVVLLLDGVIDHDERLKKIHTKHREKSKSVHVLENAPDKIAALVGKLKPSILGYETTKNSYYAEKTKLQKGALVGGALDLEVVRSAGAGSADVRVAAAGVAKKDPKKRPRVITKEDEDAVSGDAAARHGLPKFVLPTAVAAPGSVPEKFRIHFASIIHGLRLEDVNCNATFCAAIASAAESSVFSSVDLGGSSGGAGGSKSLSIVYMSLQDLLTEGSLESVGLKKVEARGHHVRVFYTDEQLEEKSAEARRATSVELQRISDEYKISTTPMEKDCVTESQLTAIRNKWKGLVSPLQTQATSLAALAFVAAAAHAPASSPFDELKLGGLAHAALHGDAQTSAAAPSRPIKRRCVFGDSGTDYFEGVLRSFSEQGVFLLYTVKTAADVAVICEGKKIVTIDVSALFSDGKDASAALAPFVDEAGVLREQFKKDDCLIVMRNNSPALFAKATLFYMRLQEKGAQVYFPLRVLDTEKALEPIMQAIERFISGT